MKKINVILLCAVMIFAGSQLFAQQKKEVEEKNKEQKVDTRIDNMRYWNEMISIGLAIPNPDVKAPDAVFTGTSIKALSVITEDSPDVPVSETNETEISVFVDPNDNTYLMNSNNSGNSGNFYGANFFFTDDGGQTYGGQVEGAGGANSGDPTTAMSLGGRMFVGFIHSNSGQGVSYSDDGIAWTSVQSAPNPGSMLDKNHLWIDNSPSSPYEGNVYDAWTDFGGTYDTEIGFVRSEDDGLSYSSKIILSSAVNAGSHNQGVNIQTGPNGEVYVVWTIYDSWPSDETALGMAVSTDGGATFAPAERILSNIKGIRTTETSKNMRVNSFPSMSVDMATGTIYVVWTNIGEPGVNSGTNLSVYMIKSDDEGETWSDAIRVNQGENVNGKEAYFPWITCDPETGTLSVIYYDDRNVSSTQVETWVSNSFDAGETWEAFKVSDVAFTPSPLPGMATGYMGDYLGIAARGGIVYPAWCDNRTGSLLTYVSPFETNNRSRPENLEVALTFETGATYLTWEYTESKNLQHFVIYRDGDEIGTTTDLFYPDNLPDYGVYSYSVSAMHDDGESGKINAAITWGSAIVDVTPESLTETLEPDQSSVQQITISNNGQLDLTYNLATQITSKYGGKAYCDASGGGDEHITGVEIGDISNTGTSASGYGDYSAMSTDVSSGETLSITITVGNPFDVDDIGVWVDWNLDEDFEDAGEEVVCETSIGTSGTYNYEIIVPDDVVPGAARMRVRLKYSGDDCGSPCGTTSYGEVEDYTLNVSNWLAVGPTSGTVTPGNTQVVDVTFSSQDLPVGVYNAIITVASNDTESPAVEVPVTLNVEDEVALALTPVAVPQNICEGEESQLYSNAVGGTGSYTFSWTSDVGGFTSSDGNPTVTPDETTTYTVEVNDGDNTLTGQVTVTVMDAISQAATPTGPTSVGNENPNTFYNTTGAENATSYEWLITPAEAGSISGGGTTGIVDWSTDFIGTAYISVKGLNDCGEGIFSNELEVDVSAGVPVIEVDNQISWDIHPNPTNGEFILGLNSEQLDIINIEIYDITGKIVYSKTNHTVWAKNSMVINLGDSPSGLYIVHISGKGVNETKKLIIE